MRKTVWLCGACGRTGKTREKVGDESCYLHSVEVYEDSIERDAGGRIVAATKKDSFNLTRWIVYQELKPYDSPQLDAVVEARVRVMEASASNALYEYWRSVFNTSSKASL